MFFKDKSLGCGYLPLFWCLFTCFTFVLCYAIAVNTGHIYPFVPAISDTGAQVPEANVFSQLFNFSCLLLVANMFVRYLQFDLVTKGYDSIELGFARLNRIAFGFGVVSAFGGTIIANFPSQEESKMVYFHDAGAVLLFGFGAVYCWIQTLLTYRMSLNRLAPVPLFAVRLILTGILSVFGSIFFIAEIFAYDQFRMQSGHTVAHWQPDDPGYSLHVLSNMGEWLAALCFGLFSMTFFDEFQRITLSVKCSARNGASSRDYLDLAEDERRGLTTEESDE
ncbi:DNA damage-regulated autophagy modulator protein 1 [Nematostella vectensis]|uniref:DNA damage-regulated autophagy modulator protein 1 n=1 Tax=Nematostella vectensis TaxID=45351 RepID=UPI002076D855|nr:DNA damage-regulated autophagy modulator protein 1 [Nematostella vectensis]